MMDFLWRAVLLSILRNAWFRKAPNQLERRAKFDVWRTQPGAADGMRTSRPFFLAMAT
jgi:hypothetical protein